MRFSNVNDFPLLVNYVSYQNFRGLTTFTEDNYIGSIVKVQKEEKEFAEKETLELNITEKFYIYEKFRHHAIQYKYGNEINFVAVIFENNFVIEENLGWQTLELPNRYVQIEIFLPPTIMWGKERKLLEL